MTHSNLRTSVVVLVCALVVGCDQSSTGPVLLDEAEPASPSRPSDPGAVPGPSIWMGSGSLPGALLPEEPQVHRPDARSGSALGQPAGAPAGGFPVVIVRSGSGGGQANGALTNNLKDAVERVAPGGTIRVFPGTYVADSVMITKPMTIVGQGGRPRIRNATALISFGIFDLPSGTVTFRGLDFELEVGSRASIQGRFDYPDIVVDDCSFEISGSTTGVEASQNSTGNGRILVTRSRFRNGQVGTFALLGGTIESRDSSFEGHTFSGLQYQSGSSGLVENSHIGPCGVVGCVRVIASTVHVTGNRFTESRTDANVNTHHIILAAANAHVKLHGNVFDGCGIGSCVLAISGSTLEAVDNRFDIYEGHGTRFAVIGSDGSGGTAVPLLPPPTLLVTDNVITGIGGTPGSFEGYPIEIAAITTELGATATAQRNTITNAQRGLQTYSNGTFVDSHDNVIHNVWWGMTMFFGSRVEARSNDVTGAVQSLAVHDSDTSLSDLTCNWWGSAAGPMNVDGGINPTLYQPWAIQPVAGQSVTTCSGGES